MTRTSWAAGFLGVVVVAALIAVAFSDSLTTAIVIAVVSVLVTPVVRYLRQQYLDRHPSRDETSEP
jgi:predicted PurR-regulated permease PerM